MTDVAEARYVDGLDQTSYHSHPALSSSQARDLLRTPALYRWRKDHPIVPTRDMELGTAVHTEVLGSGQDWTVVEAKNWQTKAAQERAAEIREQGEIPVLPHEVLLIDGMTEAVQRHPLAGPLLDPDRGTPERAVFWTDEATGVECRALIDFSPHNRRSLVDLKTTGSASRSEVRKTMARYKYPVAARWYLRGALAAGLVDEDASFIWVFVEREPPHGVAVYTLTAIDMERADERCTRALEVFRDCRDAGVWPGLPEDLQTLSLPPWTYEDEEPW